MYVIMLYITTKYLLT